MHLYISPEYFPKDDAEFCDFHDDCWLVWHEDWTYLADSYWYTPVQSKTTMSREHELHKNWFFHSRQLLRQKGFSRRFTRTTDEALEQLKHLILEGDHQPFKDSPKDFSSEDRTRVANAIDRIQINSPVPPFWATLLKF
jgi:hypothetical protein